ncbi:APC family permease [Mycolicibacterium sp. CBM1]
MGTVKLILTVLALAAPLGAIGGLAPVIIANGNGPGTPLTFGVIGVVMLLFAVGFTTMTRHSRLAGAFYAYITVGLGRPLGLGAAFIAMFGYFTLMVGAYAMFGQFADGLVSGLFGGPTLPWWVYTLGCWVVITALANFNVELSGRVLAVLMVLEVVIVMCLNIPVLISGGPEGRSLEPFTLGAFTSGAPATGILLASACFLGFEATAIYRAEVKDPDRTVPRATYLAVTLIALFYILSSWALINAVGPSQAVSVAQQTTATMFFDQLGAYAGVVAKDIAQILVVTSVFASVLSSHNPIARYAFSLGKDGVFPEFFGQAHPKHASPARASLVTSLVALGLTVPFVLAKVDVVSFYSWMFGLGAYALLILMAVTSLAVIVYFRRHRSEERLINTTVAPVLGIVGLLAMLTLISANFEVLIGGSKPVGIALQMFTIGLGVLGIVLALIWRRSRPEVYQRIGGQASEQFDT